MTRRLHLVTNSETTNRVLAAQDLADALADLPGGTDPDTVAALPDRHWKLAAERAGWTDGYCPSEETRRTVVDLLRRRSSDETKDAFRGFPTFG